MAKNTPVEPKIEKICVPVRDMRAGGFLPPWAEAIDPPPHVVVSVPKKTDIGSATEPASEPETDPDPMPWRRVVAEWSLTRRERWGLEANRLEEAGVPFPRSEEEAFQSVRGRKGKTDGPQ